MFKEFSDSRLNSVEGLCPFKGTKKAEIISMHLADCNNKHMPYQIIDEKYSTVVKHHQ